MEHLTLRGERLAPEVLCADRRELVEPLRLRIRLLDEVEAMLSRPSHLRLGSRLGPFEIRGELGEGTMGIVYLAFDTESEREVALKVFPQEFEDNSERRNRFLREAIALERLHHPNVVRFHGLERYEDRRVLVMERIQGRDLRQLSAEGRLSPKSLLETATALAAVLEAAHSKGIVHRDLKPANVMVSDEGVLKVIDFGLAHLTSDDDLTSLTADNALLGTVAYMAPEQLTGAPVDGRTDLFAFGALLYELAAGHPPFDGESLEAVILSVLTEDIEPLQERRDDVPSGLALLVNDCLSKRPEDRPATATLVRERLEQLNILEAQS